MTHARRAYSAAANPTRTQKSLEYEVIAQITHRLKSAADGGAERFSDLAAALHENRRLWTILATDVADAGNPLPAELRARIFYLAEFTTHHTSLVLRRQADIEPLLDINMAILAGLRAGTS